MTQTNDLRLVDEVAAAEILGISRKTLQGWRWRRVGVAWLKIGRLIRYDLRDLEAYIDKQRRGESE